MESSRAPPPSQPAAAPPSWPPSQKVAWDRAAAESVLRWAGQLAAAAQRQAQGDGGGQGGGGPDGDARYAPRCGPTPARRRPRPRPPPLPGGRTARLHFLVPLHAHEARHLLGGHLGTPPLDAHRGRQPWAPPHRLCHGCEVRDLPAGLIGPGARARPLKPHLHIHHQAAGRQHHAHGLPGHPRGGRPGGLQLGVQGRELAADHQVGEVDGGEDQAEGEGGGGLTAGRGRAWRGRA